MAATSTAGVGGPVRSSSSGFRARVRPGVCDPRIDATISSDDFERTEIMLAHTVLFRLRRPVGEAEREKLITGLRDFAAEAPVAAGPVHVETDLGLRDAANPRVADVALSTTFTDTDAFHAYLEHPRHRALVADVLEPLCESWLSVQNTVTPG
jgi:hypothetical protein